MTENTDYMYVKDEDDIGSITEHDGRYHHFVQKIHHPSGNKEKARVFFETEGECHSFGERHYYAYILGDTNK